MGPFLAYPTVHVSNGCEEKHLSETLRSSQRSIPSSNARSQKCLVILVTLLTSTSFEIAINLSCSCSVPIPQIYGSSQQVVEVHLELVQVLKGHKRQVRHRDVTSMYLLVPTGHRTYPASICQPYHANGSRLMFESSVPPHVR